MFCKAVRACWRIALLVSLVIKLLMIGKIILKKEDICFFRRIYHTRDVHLQ